MTQSRNPAQGPPFDLPELLVRYRPLVEAFLRLRVHGLVARKESVSDLAQSVCREALEHAARLGLRDEAAFRRWLFTEAVRKVADRFEHWHAHKRDADREVDDAALLDCYRSICTPSRAAAAREELARVEQAFARLDDDQRQVILLARVAALAHADVAREMNRSEGATRVLLHRALARLSGLLEPDAPA